MNQFLGDINHNNNVQTSIKTSIKHQSCGWHECRGDNNCWQAAN
jgi:hypothetical protein